MNLRDEFTSTSIGEKIAIVAFSLSALMTTFSILRLILHTLRSCP